MFVVVVMNSDNQVVDVIGTFQDRYLAQMIADGYTNAVMRKLKVP